MIDIRNCFTYAYSAGTFADYIQLITGDANSTNAIDLTANAIVMAGMTKPPWLIVRVGTVAIDLVTSIEIALETDTVVGFATNLKEIMTWNFALAKLTAGALLINQPFGHWKVQRWIRLYFNVVGTSCSGAAGQGLIAYIAEGPEPAEVAVDEITL